MIGSSGWFCPTELMANHCAFILGCESKTCQDMPAYELTFSSWLIPDPFDSIRLPWSTNKNLDATSSNYCDISFIYIKEKTISELG
jgi:hypothetical protein